MLKRSRKPINYYDSKRRATHNMTLTVYNLHTRDSIDIADCISKGRRRRTCNIISIVDGN